MGLYNPPAELVTANMVLYELAANTLALRLHNKTTPASMALDVLSQTFGYYFPTSEPAVGEGYVYYDSTSHKLRVRGAAGWETITSA